jgi:hypothetical protein
VPGAHFSPARNSRALVLLVLLCRKIGLAPARRQHGHRAWRNGGTPDSMRLDDEHAVTLIKAIHAEVIGWSIKPRMSAPGRGYDLTVTYAQGPIYAAASTWNIYNTSFAVGETGLARKKGWQAAASYDFGFIKIVGTYSGAKISGDNYENVTKALSKTSARSPSFSVPFGKSRVYATYTSFNDESSLDRDTKMYGVAYSYDLYENTKLYAAWGRQANNRNASYSLADGGNLVGNVTKPGTAVMGTLAGIDITFR